jgi:hypothetical protein
MKNSAGLARDGLIGTLADVTRHGQVETSRSRFLTHLHRESQPRDTKDQGDATKLSIHFSTSPSYWREHHPHDND